MVPNLSDILAKAQVLHYGFHLTEAAKKAFGEEYLIKRRIYSNYDDDDFLAEEVPPEIVFPESGIVATAILKKESPLVVDYRDGTFFLKNTGSDSQEKIVDFIKKPPFYGCKLHTGEAVESFITKLFGHSIGIFAKTRCYFAKQDTVCKFCSIRANRGRPQDACHSVDVAKVLEAVEIAVTLDDAIDDVFISGGVSTDDYDANFIFYSDLAVAVKKHLLSLGKSVEVTLNTYPPRDLDLIDRLADTGIAVMVSLEAVREERRTFICPGKSVLFHELGVENLLRKLVSVVGHGRVLAFLIQGMEEDETLLDGVRQWAELGVCAVVHILHVDPGTWVQKQKIPIPSPEQILEMAKQVSQIYQVHHLDSSVLYGGRSSLDGEASRLDIAALTL